MKPSFLIRWSGIALFLACTLFPASSWAEPVTVQAIVIQGLQSTRREVVTRNLEFGVGNVVTEDELQAAKARLLETGLFSRVEIVREEDRIHVLVEERWTLLPVAEVVRAGGLTRARLGLVEENLLGYGWTAGGYYQRFGKQNGGEVWLDLDQPGAGFVTELSGGWVYRPRPGFVHERAGGRAAFGFRTGEFDVSVGGFGRRDTLSGGLPANTDVGFRGTIRLGKLEVRDGMPDGMTVGTTLSRAFASLGSDTPWHRVEIVAVAAAPGPFAINVSTALRIGQTDASSPEEAYFLGGRHVRGFADSEFVGRRAATATLELRRTLFEVPIFALQGTVFVDAASVGDISSIAAVSTGGGLRIVFPWLAGSTLFVEGVAPIYGDATTPLLGGFEQAWDPASFGFD